MTAAGLDGLRASLGPATLVTHAGDHHVLRTPSRPDFHEGNGLHLDHPPAPADLDRWLERAEEVATGRVEHRLVRWETAGGDEPATAAAWRDAARRVGGVLDVELCMVLDTFRPLDDEPSVDVVEMADPRHWASAAALQLHAGGGDIPLEFWQWQAEQHRALVDSGRGQGLLISLMGLPAATATLLRGSGEHRGGGVATIEDVVTHPLHRGRGLASLLVSRLVAQHRRTNPGDVISLAAEPSGRARQLYERLGFRISSLLWVCN